MGGLQGFPKRVQEALKRQRITKSTTSSKEGLMNRTPNPSGGYVKSRFQDFIGVGPIKMGQLINDQKEQAQILV